MQTRVEKQFIELNVLVAAEELVQVAIFPAGDAVRQQYTNAIPDHFERHGLVVIGCVGFVFDRLDFDGASAFQTPLQVIAFPLMGASAIVLAARGQRLGLATMLVSIPTLFNVAAVIAFGVGVFLYDF